MKIKPIEQLHLYTVDDPHTEDNIIILKEKINEIIKFINNDLDNQISGNYYLNQSDHP